MENYFYCIKSLFDEWLEKWLLFMLENKVKIIRENCHVKKVVENAESNHPKKHLLTRYNYYLVLNEIDVEEKQQEGHFTQLSSKNENSRIPIKLVQLQFEDLDDNSERSPTEVFNFIKQISENLSLSIDDAVIFLLHLYLNFYDLKEYSENGANFTSNIPTYKELNEMGNIEELNNPLAYRKTKIRMKKPLWSQDKIMDFYTEIIQKHFKYDFKAPKISNNMETIIKQNNSKTNFINSILELTIQFASSYSYSPNKKYSYLFTPPPGLKKRKISKYVNAELIIKCANFFHENPSMDETGVMKTIAKEDNKDYTTIRNFLSNNKYFFPDKHNEILDIFMASEEKIYKFYDNYLIWYGRRPLKFLVD